MSAATDRRSTRKRVTAVLGPTNTGKTYLAVERMLGHASGMIGFPLRLLARENYDRIVRLKGAARVALVTGEEKIVPPSASYFVCTVESMPVDRPVAFLAIDEVQLAGDPERGHVFTDRILHARGMEETMLLGAETARPLLRHLVPGLEALARPRFSTLSHTGPRKLGRLPPRTAIVAFSAAEVYAIAEAIRRQHGGTGVVMGALSPRTRNAQVALYQAGEVDYLVATDAIGMGLNMDVDHVAFASLSKFDGRIARHLSAQEIAQIAGRAGRHMNDGSFGTTGEAGTIAPEIVEAVEAHRFPAQRAFYWRNDALSFRSLEALIASLEERSPDPTLYRVREADDHMALVALSREADIRALAGDPSGVRLLWEVCQIPDFRKILNEAHTRLIGQIFRYLRTGASVLPIDWVARQITRIDRVEGDIDTLVQRIAHIRTWTYIAHRADWLADPAHWQARARTIEDRLSDALHDHLTQRFVDRRNALLLRQARRGGALESHVGRDDEVFVEGQGVGRIEGFTFLPEAATKAASDRPFLAAARNAVMRALPARIRALEAEEDSQFDLEPDGHLTWRGARLARLRPGPTPIRPRIEVMAGDMIDAHGRERVRVRLAGWLESWLNARLGPLMRLSRLSLGASGRGLAFHLIEGLGGVPRAEAGSLLGGLDGAERRAFRRLGLMIGEGDLWLAGLVAPHSVRARALLAALGAVGAPPGPIFRAGKRWMPALPGRDERYHRAIGYRLAGDLALRVDVVDRVALAARRLSVKGELTPSAELLGLVGAPRALAAALALSGYRPAPPAAEASGAQRTFRRGRSERKTRHPARSTADSPFAKLKDMDLG